MILGALVDAGASVDAVTAALDALDLDGWEISFEEVTRSGFRATHARVATTEGPSQRTWSDIKAILDSSRLQPRVYDLASRAFQALARAEGRVHGIDPEEVHFHEVGALDAIVDIVGCCAAFCDLAGRAVTSPIVTGRGTAAGAHGEFPIPAPAVTELLHGATLIEHGSDETITPTGAALLVTFSDAFGAMPAMSLVATGYGAGSRDRDRPNLLRVLVGDEIDAATEEIVLVETNVDDLAPELVAYAIESSIRAGAADAWVTPVVMKKGRPGIVVSALVSNEHLDAVVDTLFRETTTFGVRIRSVEREILDRRWVEVTVAAHTVRVKIGERGGSTITVAPEYDDAAAAARATGMALRDVYAAATAAAREQLEDLSPREP